MKNLLLLFFFIASLSACSSGHREPFDDDTPEVRDLIDLYRNLEVIAQQSRLFSVQEIGTVTYGSFKAPILCFSYRSSDLSTDRSKILIDAGVHGNEPAGVLYVSELIALLASGSTPLSRYDIDIIPVVNPWGWTRDVRFNRDGMDINRDFSSPSSQEGKIIKHYLQDKRYDLVLDLHEHPSPNVKGIYFYQYARKNKVLLTQLIDTLQAMGYPVENNVTMILLKTENGIIDAPMWGLWYVKLTGQMSLSNYCRMNLSDNVFTLESPTHLAIERRILVHKTATRFLAEELLK